MVIDQPQNWAAAQGWPGGRGAKPWSETYSHSAGDKPAAAIANHTNDRKDRQRH